MKTVLSRNTGGRAGSPRRHCRQLVAAGLLGTTFLAGTATSVALAAVADEDMVDVTGLTAVADDSLDKLRGGFSIGGFNVNFGLIIRTAIDHQQVLMTSFKVETLGKIEDIKHDWQTYLHDNTPGGSSSSSQAASNAANQAAQAAADAAQQAAQQAAQEAANEAGEAGQQIQEAGQQVQDGVQQATEAATNNPPQPGAGDQSASSASGDTSTNDPATPDIGADVLTVTQIPNGVIIDNGNGTAVMHQIGGGIASTIVNMANGATVTHSTEMNVFIENFSDVVGQQAVFQATANMALELARTNPLLGQ